MLAGLLLNLQQPISHRLERERVEIERIACMGRIDIRDQMKITVDPLGQDIEAIMILLGLIDE